MKRKDFLFGSAAAASAIMIPFQWGCSKKDDIIVPDQQLNFKYLEVSGTNYEVGKQIGAHFSKEIIASQLTISNILNPAKQLVQAYPELFYNPFLDAAKNHFPDYIKEIEGIADGAGLPFLDIFVSNIFMEIIYRYGELNPNTPKFSSGSNLGCSTVCYSKNGKTILAHNEDLFTSFLPNLYVLKINIPGKPEFIGLNYPGMLPGIPPGMNEAGIVQSGNDICGLHIEPSVPLVFHFRSVMDATSLDEAVTKASYPHRARTMTHNIGSIEENKITSVEAAPLKSKATNVNEFYVHTNHFITPEMSDILLDPSGDASTKSRFNVLTSASQAYVNKSDEVNGELLTSFLSSHGGDPNHENISPCVHDHGGASTLAHSVFDFEKKTWKLYYSNPCLDNIKTYKL